MNEICKKLHLLFNNLPRFRFPYNEFEIPENGIYILFEKGEFAYNVDRIVRIGTHKGKNRLRSRLKEHFIKENKDRSIFRKNIGRAFLHKENDPFLKIWNMRLTKKEKEPYLPKLKQIEKKVTERIRQNFSFAVFPLKTKEERLKWEKKIIATISRCTCHPSNTWLGNYSPNKKIKESGLWQINGLYGNPLSENEFKTLKK